MVTENHSERILFKLLTLTFLYHFSWERYNYVCWICWNRLLSKLLLGAYAIRIDYNHCDYDPDKAIHYRKTFEERLQLAKYQIESIMDASDELTNSKSIEKIFLVILALGNYMNKGARGNSPGFKLSSLSKLRDTKSADGQMTLLHFLVSFMLYFGNISTYWFTF